MVTPVEIEASERLIQSIGYPKAQKLLWAASGSEGIQKAMWAALHRYPDRPIMLATRGGFHGKKGLAGDVTGESSANPNVRFISFPTAEVKPKSFYEAELDALAREFPGKIALLITEPYLGARGSYHPPKWYHKLLQDWCAQHDIPLIFDEIQACHGRTGNMYAFQTYEVEPDLVVLGKGIGNGEPGAAAVGRADLIDSLTYGQGSDTFSGNPRVCAAVCATLDVFESEKVVEHCRTTAAAMADKLHRLKARFPFVSDVRGEGLVYGVEIATSELANRCVLEAYRGTGNRGVHFMGPLAEKVLRVGPPLIISPRELNEAFEILHAAWSRIVQ
jgi:4-aminobutyrate aminotransferase-like enzyme